jgi:hypothetical protein
VALVYLQLTGAEMEPDLTTENQDERLKHAFSATSVLLVLDDCWDAEVVKRFYFLDASTNSKMLISSRLNKVLEGGLILAIDLYGEHFTRSFLVFAMAFDPLHCLPSWPSWMFT